MKKKEIHSRLEELRANQKKLWDALEKAQSPQPSPPLSKWDVVQAVWMKVRSLTYRGGELMVADVLDALRDCGLTKAEIRNALELDDAPE